MYGKKYVHETLSLSKFGPRHILKLIFNLKEMLETLSNTYSTLLSGETHAGLTL